jgi:hypothetical protein
MKLDFLSQPILVLFIASTFTMPAAIRAAASFETNDSDWADSHCQPQIYEGIQYCESDNKQIAVVIADLTTPDLRFDYAIASGNDRNENYGPCRDVNIPKWSTDGGCYDPEHPDEYPVFPSTKPLASTQKLPSSSTVITVPTHRVRQIPAGMVQKDSPLSRDKE